LWINSSFLCWNFCIFSIFSCFLNAIPASIFYSPSFSNIQSPSLSFKGSVALLDTEVTDFVYDSWLFALFADFLVFYFPIGCSDTFVSKFSFFYVSSLLSGIKYLNLINLISVAFFILF
jgi:hypothetical protein